MHGSVAHLGTGIHPDGEKEAQTMDEGHEMYEMHFPAPDVGPKNGGLTMVVALQGYADAGLAVAGSASHLIDRKSVV